MFDDSTNNEDVEDVIELYDDITSKVKSDPKESVGKLLTRMFPKLMIAYGFKKSFYQGFDDFPRLNRFLVDWSKSQRICSPDIFDAYFELSIPDGKFYRY